MFKSNSPGQNQKILDNLRIFIAYLIAFFPLAIWTIIVTFYGVNIYYQDQLHNPAPQIEAYFEGSLNGDILFQQYNECRQVFPRILSILLTILGHQWNTRWEMLLGLALSGLISLLAFLLLQQTNSRKTLQNIIIIGLFNYLFFSLATWYFRLFSITFERLLVELVFMVNLLVYTLPIGNLLKVAIFIISAFIAQYSHSGGILIWLLSFLLILDIQCNRRYKKITIILIYLLSFALSCVLYFWNYHNVSGHSSFREILKFTPLEIVRFILAFLGNPLADEYNLSVAVGLVFLSSFLIVAFCSIWQYYCKKTVTFNEILPWLVLGIYPIAQATMASITRLPMSQDHALRQDYIIHSMYLPLATLALMAILSNKSSKTFFKRFLLLFIGLLIGLFIHYNFGTNNFDQLLGFHNSLQRGKACTQLINFYNSEDCLKILHPVPKYVVEESRVLDQLGLLRPGLAKSLDIDSDSSGKWGYIESLEKDPQGIVMHGWAILEKRPADAIVVTYEAKNQSPRIIHIYVTGQVREDISKLLKNPNFYRVGWNDHIKLEQLPSEFDICSIHVYGFDNENNRLFPLNKVPQIQEKCQI
jgi:hypothetical protein